MNQQHLSPEEISTILQTRFGIKPTVQVYHDKGTGRILYGIEHIPADRKISIGGLKRYCTKICHALDADLDGTVNIEFISLGDVLTFDIIAEARQCQNRLEQSSINDISSSPSSAVSSSPSARRDDLNASSHTPFSDGEFHAIDDLNEAVFNLYEHAAARNLDTLSPELADMIEDAWKFLQPVKCLGLIGRMTDAEFCEEKERREVKNQQWKDASQRLFS